MITKNIYIEDLVKEYPHTVGILTSRGVICIQCGEPVWGTLGEALERAGVEDDESLIRELNEAAASV